MSQSAPFEIKSTGDLTDVVRAIARRDVKIYVSNHTQGQVEARLQAVPNLDEALSLDAHEAVLTTLVDSMRAYRHLVELQLLQGHVDGSKTRSEAENEMDEFVGDATDPIETRSGTPETEASTVVAPGSDGAGADEELLQSEGKEKVENDARDRAKGESKDWERELGNLVEDEPSNFADRTNRISTIPKKDSSERAFLWSQMEVNTGVVCEMQNLAKNGRLFDSRTVISSIPFEVRIKESSIRPVFTMCIDNKQDVDNAQALVESDVSDQFLMQPAMPVMVTLKFPKLSEVPEYQGIQRASVNVELGPATIAQIFKTAFLLYRLQADHWEDGDKSWTCKAMSLPK